MTAEEAPLYAVPDWAGGAGDCFWCGRRCEPPADGLTRDHIVPLSQGGAHDYTNIAPACYQCNQARGRVAEYAGRLKAYRAGVGASPKALRQLWDLYPDAAAGYARWYDVEVEKVGYSPTSLYDVSEPPEPRPPDPPPQPPPKPAVPVGPGVGRFRLSGRDTGGTWAADVEAARRRAEGLPTKPAPEPPAQREATYWRPSASTEGSAACALIASAVPSGVTGPSSRGASAGAAGTGGSMGRGAGRAGA